MNPTSKKFISLFLVVSLLALSGNLYAKKRGAELLIQKKNGSSFKGELIAVKENSLLLLQDSVVDVSIDIEDIKIIRIVKKSKLLKGMGIGLLIGAGGGAILGYAQGDGYGTMAMTAESNALAFGMAFCFLGLLTGLGLGAAAGTDKTIQIEGKSNTEIQKTMDKLRKKARIRDYK